MINDERLAEISARLDRLLGANFLAASEVDISTSGGVSPEFVEFNDIAVEIENRTLLAQFSRDLFAGLSVNSIRNVLLIIKDTSLAALQACVEQDPSLQPCIDFLLGTKDGVKGKKIIVKFYKSDACDERIVMLKGKDDGAMVEFGKKYGMPRGCVILWKPNVSVDVRGFFPKFKNDEIDEKEFDLRLLEGATSISFFKKWSGFLLHIIAFKSGSRYCWTVCSKNSANYKPTAVQVQEGYAPVIQWGKDLVDKIVKPEKLAPLVCALADNHWYLGGEAMDPRDVHGYRARRQAIIVTCVGQGTYVDLVTASNNVVNTDGRLMQYWTPDKVQGFALQYGLNCDNSVRVTTDADGRALYTFIEAVLKDRDMLVDDQFEERLRAFTSDHPGSVAVKPGSVSHAEYVGNILEGFVFNIEYADGRKGTVKVKLAHYTWRTMFLRELIKKAVNNEGFQFVSSDAKSSMDYFLKRWCCSEGGRNEFRGIIKNALVLLSETKREDYSKSGYHVVVANAVTSDWNNGAPLDKEKWDRRIASFDAVCPENGLSSDAITVCLVLGPIGSGKSTVMSRLAADTQRFVAIDGDLVAGADTLSMGSERVALTFSAVYSAILGKKTPVVSLGGGVFCNPRLSAFILSDSIKKVFGHETNIVTVLMSGESGGAVESVSYSDLEALDFFEKEYSRLTAPTLAQIIDGRMSRGDPLYPKKSASEAKALVDKMIVISSKNKVFAKDIASKSSALFTVPYVVDNSYDFLTRLDLSEVSTALLPVPSDITSGKFDQIRAVFSVDLSPTHGKNYFKTGSHVTLFYRDKTDGTSTTSFAAFNELKAAVMERCDELGVMKADVYTLWFKPENWSDSSLEMVKKHSATCKKVMLAVLPGSIGTREGLHLTEETGPFPAEKMMDVAKWINDGKKDKLFMSLQPKGKPEEKYFLEDCGAYEISMRASTEARSDSKFKIPAAITVQTVQYHFKDLAAFIRGDA